MGWGRGGERGLRPGNFVDSMIWFVGGLRVLLSGSVEQDRRTAGRLP